MDNRDIPFGPRNGYYEPGTDTGHYGTGREYTYSSARDYASAGRDGGQGYRGRDRGFGGRDRDSYGPRQDYGGSYWRDEERSGALGWDATSADRARSFNY